jgi:hypothetical protein
MAGLHPGWRGATVLTMFRASCAPAAERRVGTGSKAADQHA